MKILKTFFALATLVLAVAACTKDELKENPAQNGNISVEITGSLGELLPADNTKGSVSSVVRLNWTNGDKVYAFDATRCLGSLTAIVDPNNKTIASLSGTIGEPAGGIITIVYTNISNDQPEIDDNGKMSFDFSEQTLDKIPYVAYATIAYEAGKTPLSGITIPFSFASSVMKVSATGLIDDVAIDEVFPGGVNTVCELTLSNTDAPAISGTAVGNITLTKGSKSFSLAGGKTIVSFGVVKTGSDVSSDTRDITFKQGIDYRWSRLLNDYEIKEQKAINTVVDTYVRLPYVEIEADYDNNPATPNTKLKWYKENLTLTDSGKKLFKGRRNDGTNTGHVNGDYFQWAAYENYALPVQDLGNGKTDKGLLLYTSFTSECCIGNADNDLVLKLNGNGIKYCYYDYKSEEEPGAISPYLDLDNEYIKYTNDSTYTTLASTDDVASIILGDNWRIPTTAEFQAMLNATYWAWDEADGGCYVFTPLEGDAGKWNDEKSALHTYEKSDALLFFPSTSYCDFYNLWAPGYNAVYWSSNHYAGEYGVSCAGALQFTSIVKPTMIIGTSRSFGYTVRPVSD